MRGIDGMSRIVVNYWVKKKSHTTLSWLFAVTPKNVCQGPNQIKSKICLLHQNKNQCRSYINNNIIINDVLVQKGSGEAMLVKFLNPFDDKQNLCLGHLNRWSAKNVQCNKLNSLQHSVIILYAYNVFTHTNINTIFTKLHYQHFNNFQSNRDQINFFNLILNLIGDGISLRLFGREFHNLGLWICAVV